MITAFNTWLHVPEDKLHIIARIVSMLHNASLLQVPPLFYVTLYTQYTVLSIDDIEDDSQLRRGQPGRFIHSVSFTEANVFVLGAMLCTLCIMLLWRTSQSPAIL